MNTQLKLSTEIQVIYLGLNGNTDYIKKVVDSKCIASE